MELEERIKELEKIVEALKRETENLKSQIRDLENLKIPKEEDDANFLSFKSRTFE